MNKKKYLAIVFIIVLVMGIVVAAAINHNMTSSSNKANNSAWTNASSEPEKTTFAPELRMLYPDRLNGTPESNYEAKDNTIIVTYGKSGTLKRVFASEELLTSDQNYTEETTQEIDGNTITLNGKNGMIYTAAWIENYNSYLIELNPEGEGVAADEMAAYVAAAE